MVKKVIVYLDLVIISTIIVNTLIVEGIELMFKRKVSIIRVILSDVLSCLLLAIYLLPIGKITYIRYIMGIPIGFLAFRKTSFKELIIKILIYYFLNIALVGSLAIFKIHSLTFIVLSTIVIISINMIEKFLPNNMVYISIDRKERKALLDTGNSSYYQNKPIIFLSKKFFNNSYQYQTKISISHIGGKSDINIYSGPLLKYNNTNYFVYYAFIDISGYDLILHKDMGGKLC